MLAPLPFEWFVLILRVLFICLLYFFIFQVIRVISRELRLAAVQQSQQTNWSSIPGALLVDDPSDTPLRRGQKLALDPVTIIGRDRRATIQADGSFVSAEHAQLSWEHDRWWVSDLKSTNGTLVNGRAIAVPTSLSYGDYVDVGGVRFQLIP